MAAGSGWRRLIRAARPRVNRTQLFVAVLGVLLGLAGVAQFTQDQTEQLASLRQSELVQIMDDLTERRDRVATELAELAAEEQELRSGTVGSEQAVAAAQERLDDLEILAGTVAATGPGVEVTLTDPKGAVRSAQILDLVQELRDAGAETLQVGSVRVVVATSFTDVSGTVVVDGVSQRPPHRIIAIGDGPTMATALNIPGGFFATLPATVTGSVEIRDSVQIDALRSSRNPR
ncbi:MAG: DUF881 domain-containing protein [Actinomycetota bacterium]